MMRLTKKSVGTIVSLFCLILSSKLLDLERKTSHESAFAGISRELYLHPQPLKGERGVARGESRFPLQAKPPLSKGGLVGLSIWSRTLPRNAQKSDNLSIIAVRWAENESLSICSPLCISSNYLCPVLYSQFEGHLGCFKVSFSSPTFAIQTSELQLLTTNLRIIFELTKSKRDGLYL